MMDAISQFHFIRPQWLLGIIPLAWLVWSIGRNSAGSAWSKWCDPMLLPHILLGIGQDQDDAPRRAYWPSKLWLAVAGLLALLAMAGPVWEKQPVPVFPDRSALVIVLNLAHDMNVNDVQPNRLSQAKFKVSDLLSRRREGSVALVVYAGDAFVVSPLTDDVATVVSQLESLDVNIMPVPGRRAAQAIALASKLMDNAGHEGGAVLLLTSGEDDLDSAKEQAGKLYSQGRQLYVLGVGTTAGAPVPLAEGFAKDKDGGIVFSRREDADLTGLAQAGGGLYWALGADSADVDAVAASLALTGAIADDEVAGKSQETTFWLERGQWLLLPLLPLAALAFRRGVLFALTMVAVNSMMLIPQPAMAGFWDDLWQRPDQQAAALFEQGREGAAARKFEDITWKAAAYYSIGNYEQAELLLREARQVVPMYMRANAMAQMSRFEEALGIYGRILELEPGHKDARHNRDLVLQKLKEQEQGQAGEPGQQGEQGQAGEPGQQGEQGQQGQQGEDGSQAGQGQQMMQEQSGGESGEQAQMMQEQDESDDGAEQNAQSGSTDGEGADNDTDGQQQYIVPKEESEVAQQGEDGQQQMLLQKDGGGEEGEESEQSQTILSDKDADEDDGGSDSDGDKRQRAIRNMTKEQREQHMAAEIWMRNINGRDSSFLKHKFQRQHQQRQRVDK